MFELICFLSGLLVGFVLSGITYAEEDDDDDDDNEEYNYR